MKVHPLARPGIYAAEECPSEAYHSSDRISRGQLWTLHSKSPAHLLSELEAPSRETRAMARGAAMHLALLEPERFLASYVWPDFKVDRRTKVGKAEWEAFEADANAAGKTILGYDAVNNVYYSDDAEAVLRVSSSVASDPTMSRLFRGSSGESEMTFAWDEGGEDVTTRFRVRFDRLNQTPRGWVALDLKSTTDARPRAFQRSMMDYGYHFQAAMYRDGFSALRPQEELQDFVFVLYETAPPYAHSFVRLHQDVIDAGRMAYRQAVARLRACMAKNEWPGYDEAGIQTVELPGWYKA